MTEFQLIRKSLMKKLQQLENNEDVGSDLDSILGISDAVTRSYNTELRAKELEFEALDSNLDLSKIDVFKEVQ